MKQFMSKRNYRFFLTDIKDSAYKILEYTEKKSYKDFRKNQMLMDAVVRNLEVIGEAVKNISEKVKRKYPQVEWRKIANLRNILIHEYFGIDEVILWDIVKNKIPDLLLNLEEILKAEQENRKI